MRCVSMVSSFSAGEINGLSVAGAVSQSGAPANIHCLIVSIDWGGNWGCPSGIWAPFFGSSKKAFIQLGGVGISGNDRTPIDKRGVFHQECFSIGAIGAMADKAASFKDGVGILR